MARGSNSRDGRVARSELGREDRRDLDGEPRSTGRISDRIRSETMNGIDLSLEKSAFKINSSPSARSIIEEDALKRAIKGAEEALTFARRARTEAEGYSTGNPSDKSTMAYATIEGRTAILSELIKDMTRSAKRLDAYWEKDPKKQEEYRADFEYEGVGIEDLEKEYETDALAVLDTITKIREAVMRNA